MTLLAQALRGQSILQPDAVTLAMLGAVIAASAAAWMAAAGRPLRVPAAL